MNPAAHALIDAGACRVVHLLPNAPVPPAGRGSYNHLLHDLAVRRASSDLVVSSFDPASWRLAEGSQVGLVQVAGRRNHLTDSLIRAVLSRAPGLSPPRRHDLRLGRSARLLERRVLTPASPRLVCLWGDLRWARLVRRGAPDAFLVFAQRHHRISQPHRPYYPDVDRVVFLTETARRTAIADGFVTAGTSLAIRNGVELSRFTPASDAQRRTARRELGVGDDALLFLMPSTLSRQKGVFSAVRWFRTLEGSLSDLRPVLLLAGVVHPAMSRQDRGRLEREIDHPSILALRGVPASRMPALYEGADICLHPSVNEGFGLAIVEAMACGLPVVAVDSGAVPELIEPDVTGVLLADRRDDERAVAALLDLARNPALRQRLGRAARTAALRFSRSAAVDAWSGYLDACLRGAAC